MADTVRFALTYEPDGAGPATIVGKFTSQDEQSHATGRIMRAYEVEVRFYAEVAPRVANRLPAAAVRGHRPGGGVVHADPRGPVRCQPGRRDRRM